MIMLLSPCTTSDTKTPCKQGFSQPGLTPSLSIALQSDFILSLMTTPHIQIPSPLLIVVMGGPRIFNFLVLQMNPVPMPLLRTLEWVPVEVVHAHAGNTLMSQDSATPQVYVY
jgi:hypothetical protein